jgi:UDPglucose 6-dehydrogenase
MQLAVIGVGYVGLVTGVSLAATHGHHVTLIERSASRLVELRNGRMPIEEPGLAEAFDAARGRLTIADTLDAAVRPDLVFICVGTPTGDDGDSDLSQLHAAAIELRDRPDLHLSVRSTLPPGTSARLPGLFGRDDSTRLSTNPEFLRQGSAMADYGHPSRIVIGLYDDTSAEHVDRVERALAPVEAPLLKVTVAAAELIKNVANGFLALKLSFVNEVATLAEECGVDVDEILEGIALDPRIGSAYMRPGLGFGGSCLPKELQVLAAAGRKRGVAMHVARAAAQVNGEQQDRFIRRVLAELPGKDARVGLLGLSFKAFTDDLRGSPAIYVARRLTEAGHQVVAFDPAARPSHARESAPGIEIVGTAAAVFEGTDAVVIATDWPEFAEIDLREVRQLVRRPLLFDGRNMLDPQRASDSGFDYRGVGRRPRDAATQRARPSAL